jgi:hypothetical protein
LSIDGDGDKNAYQNNFQGSPFIINRANAVSFIENRPNELIFNESTQSVNTSSARKVLGPNSPLNKMRLQKQIREGSIDKDALLSEEEK